MPITLADAAGGFALPAIVAGAILFVLHRYAPVSWFKQIAASAALVAGFVVGYAFLDVAPWRPKFHWHWLPYVALLSLAASLACGDLIRDANKRRVVGAIAGLLTIFFAAWSLVPTWPHLEPSRTIHITVWTICVFTLAMLLNRLVPRLPGAILPTVLAGTMLAAAVLILLSESLKNAQIAGAAAGAMIGIAIIPSPGWQAQGSRGIAPTFAILISSLLLVARVDSHSDVPLISYFLIPLAPLGLWLVAIPRIAQLEGWRRRAALLPIPIVALAFAIGLAAWKTLV